MLKIVGNSNFLAIYTDQFYLYQYNLSGISLSEPYYLPDLCFLECNHNFSLLAIQLNGDLHLWHIARQHLILKQNIIPLVYKGIAKDKAQDFLEKCFLDDNNNILLNFASKKVFRYDTQTTVFKRVKEPRVLNMEHSTIDFSHLTPHSELAELLFGASKEPNKQPCNKVDQVHLYQFELTALEERLSTAKKLKLNQEYWIMFKKYILLLVETKNYGKINSICMELQNIKDKKEPMCSVFNLTDEEFKNGIIMGINVELILNEEMSKLLEGHDDPKIIEIAASFKPKK